MKRKSEKVKIPTYNIETLCEMVNDKYGLKPNDVGSIEIYSSMDQLSVEQVCNQYRGTRTLITGDTSGIKQYLRNILDDKIILNFWNIIL